MQAIIVIGLMIAYLLGVLTGYAYVCKLFKDKIR